MQTIKKTNQENQRNLQNPNPKIEGAQAVRRDGHEQEEEEEEDEEEEYPWWFLPILRKSWRKTVS